MTQKRIIGITLAGFSLLGIYFQTAAQQRGRAPKIHYPTAVTYLSGGQISDKSTVSVSLFDSLVAQSLLVKDSLGRVFPVHSFSLMYVSRGLYSDSTGHPVILSDYLYSASSNGVLPAYWINGLIPQVKAGDSAIFMDVRYYSDTSKNAALQYGNTMKLIITP